MSDTQLLRDILAELRKISRTLDDIDKNTTGIEQAVWDTAPN